MRKVPLILELILVFTVFVGVLTACHPKDDPIINYDLRQKLIDMTVSVGAEKIEIDISCNASELGSDKVRVVSMKAYEYYTTDEYNGLSDSVSDGDASWRVHAWHCKIHNYQ